MPRRYVERDSVIRSLGRALEHEALTPLRWSRHGSGLPSPYSWYANYAGNCSAPVHIFRDGVPLTKRGKSHVFGPMNERVQLSELEVRCRQCRQCLEARAHHWRMRAKSEWLAAHRTWFGTLTLSPDRHVAVGAQAALWAGQNIEGKDFNLLSEAERFGARHRVISKEITDYVKRLRKNSGASLRLMCVVEAHKSGLPHYHMLVHEVSPADVIRKRVLQRAWRWGFSSWKLVDDYRAAGYVTKYLAKSSLARVRASVDYGNPPNTAYADSPVGGVQKLDTPVTEKTLVNELGYLGLSMEAGRGIS